VLDSAQRRADSSALDVTLQVSTEFGAPTGVYGPGLGDHCHLTAVLARPRPDVGHM